MLEQYEILAQNMTVYPRPQIKGSLVKRRRNWIQCRQQYSTKELLSYLVISISVLLFLIIGE